MPEEPILTATGGGGTGNENQAGQTETPPVDNIRARLVIVYTDVVLLFIAVMGSQAMLKYVRFAKGSELWWRCKTLLHPPSQHKAQRDLHS